MIEGLTFVAGYAAGIVTAIVVVGIMLPEPEEWRSRMNHPTALKARPYPEDAVPNATRADVISDRPGRSDINFPPRRVIVIRSDE